MSAQDTVADGFVDLKKVDPSIFVEMRYFSSWNFIGKPIAGYKSNTCYLTKKAAEALVRVQKQLKEHDYSLLVFDCYRPKKAVQEFLRWTRDSKDMRMKTIFYPDEEKQTLISRGYISSKSGHSRGSTLDLTIIKKDTPLRERSGYLTFQEESVDCRKQKDIESTAQLDMGTMYDCFSILANQAARTISESAKKNRSLLKTAMEKQGFVGYDKEWWHFTLKAEPFPDSYFDFDVVSGPDI